MASLALVLPGANPAVVAPAAAGVGKLEPRFHALMQERQIPEPIMLKFVDAEILEIAVFGNVGSSKDKVEEFLKLVIDVDPSLRPAEFALKAKLLTIWESCRTRIEVEAKTSAERQVANLPPQISPDEYEAAKRSFEALQGYQPGRFPPHLMPSQPFFERLLDQVQKFYVHTELTTVINSCQADSNVTNQMGLDQNGTFKIQKKEFGIPLPMNSESLRNRLAVFANGWFMVKMRFSSNPRIATITQEMFLRYTDFLMGPQVLGNVFVSSPDFIHNWSI